MGRFDKLHVNAPESICKLTNKLSDPLSAYLFILCLETLFIQIREGNNVKGIGIGDYQVKPSLFTQTIWNSLWLMSSFYNQTCSTFQLYPSFILDPENSLMLAGLEVKWALMKCRSAVRGKILNAMPCKH